MAHAFLSYVRENAPIVDRLASDLGARGIQIWLDRERIVPGQRWRDAIRDGIRSGDLFIACFSTEYLSRNRSYMNEELTLAMEELRQRPTHRSWFIPVSLDGSPIPSRAIGGGETIHDLQWVDLAADWNRGVEMISRAVAAASTQASSDSAGAQDAATHDGDDPGLLDAGDSFVDRMTVFGAARSRIIAAIVDFHRTVLDEGPEMQRVAGMTGVRRLMEWRAELLETLVAHLRADIPVLISAFDSAITNLRHTITLAGEVGLEVSMKSSNWKAALAQAAKAIESDREELSATRTRIAQTGRFTTRLNRAKRAAVAEIDRLLEAYRRQAEMFDQLRQTKALD